MPRALLATVLLMSCATPPAAETPERESAPILAGAVDTSGSPPGVGFLPAASGGSVCTATLVAPDVILTAKHCVEPARPAAFYMGPGCRIRPDNGSLNRRLTNGTCHFTATLGVARIVKHPDEDLAMVKLASSASSFVPLATSADAVARTGTALVEIGYGRSPSATDPGTFTVGLRRRADVVLAGFEPGADTPRHLLVTYDPAVAGQGIALGGDSGGPILHGGQLVGVTVQSSAEADCGGKDGPFPLAPSVGGTAVCDKQGDSKYRQLIAVNVTYGPTACWIARTLTFLRNDSAGRDVRPKPLSAKAYDVPGPGKAVSPTKTLRLDGDFGGLIQPDNGGGTTIAGRHVGSCIEYDLGSTKNNAVVTYQTRASFAGDTVTDSPECGLSMTSWPKLPTGIQAFARNRGLLGWKLVGTLADFGGTGAATDGPLTGGWVHTSGYRYLLLCDDEGGTCRRSIAIDAVDMCPRD